MGELTTCRWCGCGIDETDRNWSQSNAYGDPVHVQNADRHRDPAICQTLLLRKLVNNLPKYWSIPEAGIIPQREGHSPDYSDPTAGVPSEQPLTAAEFRARLKQAAAMPHSNS